VAADPVRYGGRPVAIVVGDDRLGMVRITERRRGSAGRETGR